MIGRVNDVDDGRCIREVTTPIWPDEKQLNGTVFMQCLLLTEYLIVPLDPILEI